MTLTAGLAGFGLAGRVLHTPLMLDAGLRIVAAVTAQHTALQSTLPNARAVDTMEQLLNIQPLDIVVIVTPNHLHAAQARLALQAGKHVVIDKPVALTVAEAESLIALSNEVHRSLTVFHNRRWDSDFLTVQKLMNDGTLGTPYQFEACWDRWRPEVIDRWRERDEPGAGILYDLGPHLIDQALMLFGMPDWLQAEVYRQRDGAVCDDAFEIRMGKDALRITLAANSLSHEPRPRFRIQGSKGTFTKHGLDVQEAQLRAGIAPDAANFGIEPASQWGKLVTSEKSARIECERGNWQMFYRNLVEHIELGQPLAVTASQAANVLRIIEAARSSSISGSRVALSS
jgi:scyllo-inositol 2-dehydrogenase (NADP+)